MRCLTVATSRPPTYRPFMGRVFFFPLFSLFVFLSFLYFSFLFFSFLFFFFLAYLVRSWIKELGLYNRPTYGNPIILTIPNKWSADIWRYPQILGQSKIFFNNGLTVYDRKNVMNIILRIFMAMFFHQMVNHKVNRTQIYINFENIPNST